MPPGQYRAGAASVSFRLPEATSPAGGARASAPSRSRGCPAERRSRSVRRRERRRRAVLASPDRSADRPRRQAAGKAGEAPARRAGSRTIRPAASAARRRSPRNSACRSAYGPGAQVRELARARRGRPLPGRRKGCDVSRRLMRGSRRGARSARPRPRRRSPPGAPGASCAVAGRVRPAPGPGRGDDLAEIRMRRLPAEDLAARVLRRDQRPAGRRHAADRSRGGSGGPSTASAAASTSRTLKPSPLPEVQGERHAPPSTSRSGVVGSGRLEREQVRPRQVLDVDVVADAGPVGRRVVVAEERSAVAALDGARGRSG